MSRQKLRSIVSSAVKMFLGEATKPESDLQWPGLARLIEDTRRMWALDSRLRFPAKPGVRMDKDGTWIEVWILAGDLAPIDTEALSAACHALPLWPGEVYRLFHQESMKYKQIADHLGLPVDEVRELLSDALSRLDAGLGHD